MFCMVVYIVICLINIDAVYIEKIHGGGFLKSLWIDNYKKNPFPELQGDTKTNVLIIGGGMAGVLCAYFLEQAGVDYVLLEADTIGSGITKNTTAKITSQHGLIYKQLINHVGIEKSKMYLEANQLALKKFSKLCEDIDCDFEQKDAYVYSRFDRRAIEKEVTALNELGFKAEYSQEIALPFKIAGSIQFKNQAQFNPLKFISGISKDLNIYENTRVKEIGENFAITNNGKITAENIIIATHFPIINKHGGYFLKMYQHRSYAIALKNAPDLDGMYLEETMNGLSFRNYKDMLIIGGGDHKTGKIGGNWRVLRDFAETTYPQAVEEYSWATQDCMTLDSVPYIGRYSKSSENLYVATGFNKWGMTSSMVSAIMLTDMITGKKNEYSPVFSPSRSMLTPQLLANGWNALVNLINFRTKRCPHMGCALRWNNVERSWDCPCHGSRFDENGKLLDNPATGSLEK